MDKKGQEHGRSRKCRRRDHVRLTAFNKTRKLQTNKRKATKALIKAKRNLKREASVATPEARYDIIGRIRIINEAIKIEDRKQHKSKINKVVNNLKSKNGLNVPNMWS